MGPSKTPTKLEREWMDKAVRLGCIACRVDGRLYEPAEIHHIVSGSRRMGHLFTIPLCPAHHRHGTQDAPSVHPWKRRFEDRYGSQLVLLAMVKELAGIFTEASYT